MPDVPDQALCPACNVEMIYPIEEHTLCACCGRARDSPVSIVDGAFVIHTVPGDLATEYETSKLLAQQVLIITCQKMCEDNNPEAVTAFQLLQAQLSWALGCSALRRALALPLVHQPEVEREV